MGRESTIPNRSNSTRKPPKEPQSQSEDDEDTEEEGEVSVQDEWETSVGDVGVLLEALKNNLAQIDPGIGDRITLAKFCAFVEANSSSLR
jgi:hypothetical protein